MNFTSDGRALSRELFPYRTLTLCLFNDLAYSHSSADNFRTYEHVIVQETDHPECVSSKHGLAVLSNGEEISSAILLAGGGASGVHGRSLVVVEDHAYVCVGNSVAALSLPSLKLEWFQPVDDFTAFQIFAIPMALIVHGEHSISRISFDGAVAWKHRGSDIFVSPNGEKGVTIEGDIIHAQSWDGRKYRINHDGNCSTT